MHFSILLLIFDENEVSAIKNKKTANMEENDDFIDFGDVGGFETDFDIDFVDFVATDKADETRYMKPRIAKIGKQVLYKYAVNFANEIKIDTGLRIDAFIAGTFIFGDFIEALLTEKNIHAKRITISTLSLNQENVDSLAGLMRRGYIGELNLIISCFAWNREKFALVPYLLKELDIDNRFQLSVARIHTKTVHFETEGGKKIIIHGSANLCTSGNIEQITIEENPELFDFYDEKFNLIIEKYKTINKALPREQMWNLISENKEPKIKKQIKKGGKNGK